MNQTLNDRLYEREQALATLNGLAKRAQERSGSLVLISGEAGVGKTSLVRHAVEAFSGLQLISGYGEPTATARPLGVVHDIAVALPGLLREQLRSASQPWLLYEALMDDLRSSPGLPLIWIEDAQWADQGSIDLLRYLARRCSTLKLLLVVTIREFEPRSNSTRETLISGLPIDQWTEIRLARLSESAVGSIARDHGHDATALFQLTKGNPLFVVSALRWSEHAVWGSLAHLAQQKLSVLDPAAVALIRLLATHPDRIERSAITGLSEATPLSIELCLKHGWLVEVDGTLSFEHELLRRAVLDSIDGQERALLHQKMLGQSLSLAHQVHHALNAQDWTALQKLAPRAAQESMRAKAYREAAAYWRLALERTEVSVTQRASWLEQLGWVSVLSGDSAGGQKLFEQALEIWRESSNTDGILRCMANVVRWPQRVRAFAQTFTPAEIEAALRLPTEAGQEFSRAILSVELARHYAALRQVQLALDRLESVRKLASQTESVAERTELRWWICWVEFYQLMYPLSEDVNDILERALALELDHFVVQVMILRALSASGDLQLEPYEQFCAEGLAYCERRDMQVPAAVFRYLSLWSLFLNGQYDRFLELAPPVIEQLKSSPPNASVLKVMRHVVLARKTGEPQSSELAAAAAEIERFALSRTVSLAQVALVDIYWIEGNIEEARRLTRVTLDGARLTRFTLQRTVLQVWVKLLGGIAVSDIDSDTVKPQPDPTSDVTGPAGNWRNWRLPYEQALALAAGDASERKDALATLKRLGANGTIRRLREQWSEAGLDSVPRGANESTVRNPAGLTKREMQLLALLVEGLSNAAIADRVQRSPRTVEHHLSSILAKTGSKSRADAIKWARQQGIDKLK